MARGGVSETPAALVHGNLARAGTPPEEVATMLAQEALSLSGAAAVHIYLWDPVGDFLYGAGTAGSGGDELDSTGFSLGEGIGFIFFRSGKPSSGHKARLSRIALTAGQLLERRQDLRRLPLAGPEEATTAFMSALKAKSPITAQHCARVARYAAATALALGLSEAGVCHVERCGLLHDIGKLGIGDEVLEKPGALTPAEWIHMKLHPQIGVRILRSCRSLEAILPAIAMHHERFDGKGYPGGVTGYAIPVEARIVNVCDAYDTMTSDRPYQKSLDAEEAIARLRCDAGAQFDPDLVHVFAADVFPTLAGGILRTRNDSSESV